MVRPLVDFQRAPALEGAVAEVGIRFAFEVESPIDTAGAVRRAASFPHDQRIEPQNVDAPAPQRMERRASHEAQADDGDVASAHENILP